MEQKTTSFTEFDRLYGKYGQKLHFPVCLSEFFLQTEIEELDLSVRSYKFQCSLLPAEEQQNYIRRVEEMSMEACHERKDESRKSF